MTLEDAIAYSRNVVAAKVALGLAPTTQGASEILHETWTRLGFGSPTGIDVAGEVRGLVNDPATTLAPDRPRERLVRSGRGDHPDPARTAYAALVNGGILVTPHVVAGVGAERSTPASERRSWIRSSARSWPGSWSTSSRARGTPSTPRSPATGSAARPAPRRSGTRSVGAGRRSTTSRASGSSAGAKAIPTSSAVRIQEAHRVATRGQLSFVSPRSCSGASRPTRSPPGLLPVLRRWLRSSHGPTGDGRRCHTFRRDRRGAAAERGRPFPRSDAALRPTTFDASRADSFCASRRRSGAPRWTPPRRRRPAVRGPAR